MSAYLFVANPLKGKENGRYNVYTLKNDQKNWTLDEHYILYNILNVSKVLSYWMNKILGASLIYSPM